MTSKLQSVACRPDSELVDFQVGDFLHHLDALGPLNGQPVILWCRVSGKYQASRGNLDDQKHTIRNRVRQRGGKVVKTYRRIGKGFDRRGKSILYKALAHAQRIGGLVVAESPDRFLRHRDFDVNTAPDKLPSATQWDDLRMEADGVILATLTRPDLPASEVRSHQRKRGQKAKLKWGGRPKKPRCLPKKPPCPPGDMKLRRSEQLPLVLELDRQGDSLSEIAHFTGVPRGTVYEWLRKCKEGVWFLPGSPMSSQTNPKNTRDFV